jgi:hypothetical protein
MSKASFRFLTLCFILTLSVLAQHPRIASAATCPSVRCGTLITECEQLCSAGFSLRQIGTCTANGQTVALGGFECFQCFSSECH